MRVFSKYTESDRYITYTLVTNFPEIWSFIIGFSFTSPQKKNGKK